MLLIRKLRHLPEIPQLGSDGERSVPLKPTFLIPYNVCYVWPSRSKHGKSLCSSMCHGGCSWSSLSNPVVHLRGGALLLSTIPSAPCRPFPGRCRLWPEHSRTGGSVHPHPPTVSQLKVPQSEESSHLFVLVAQEFQFSSSGFVPLSVTSGESPPPTHPRLRERTEPSSTGRFHTGAREVHPSKA